MSTAIISAFCRYSEISKH